MRGQQDKGVDKKKGEGETDASQPKRSCPTKVPTGVATLRPRSWLAVSAPPAP